MKRFLLVFMLGVAIATLVSCSDGGSSSSSTRRMQRSGASVTVSTAAASTTLPSTSAPPITDPPETAPPATEPPATEPPVPETSPTTPPAPLKIFEGTQCNEPGATGIAFDLNNTPVTCAIGFDGKYRWLR